MLQEIDNISLAIYNPPVKGFGLMYNSYAFRHADFAPANWKVPSKVELTLLATNIGSSNAIRSIRTYPAFATGWSGGGGLDNYGFSLLPSGAASNRFNYVNSEAYITSSDLYISYSTDIANLRVSSSVYAINRSSPYVGVGVRLLMIDSSGWSEGDTVTDTDGNVYDTVNVKGQIWTVSNWKCTTLCDIGHTVIPNVVNRTTWIGLTTPAYCIYNNAATIIEEV